MEGRYFAVIFSIAVWCIGYAVAIYCFGCRFDGLVPGRFRSGTRPGLVWIWLMAMLVAAPLLAGTAYRIGGMMEEGNGIAWGCYIEWFGLGGMSLWMLSLVGLSLPLAAGLLRPGILGFEHRTNVLLFYVGHHLYTLALLGLMGLLIPLLSGPLSSKGASCF